MVNSTALDQLKLKENYSFIISSNDNETLMDHDEESSFSFQDNCENANYLNSNSSNTIVNSLI